MIAHAAMTHVVDPRSADGASPHPRRMSPDRVPARSAFG
jgi:hypothetical protein